MARTNIIPGAESFSFCGGDLHGNLQRLDDTESQDLVEHRPLKRDGAILESMGWQARRYLATVAFVGPSFRADVVALRKKIREQPEGVLVHPIYGSLRARCEKIEGALNIAEAADATDLKLTFAEQGLDQNQLIVATQAVAAKAAALSSQAADLVTWAVMYALAAPSIASLAALAEAYSEAALASARLGTPDPSLANQVDAIEREAEAAIAAITADPAASLDVDRWDALAAADLLYAAALDLDAALATQRPALVPYTVPSPIGLLPLSTQFYGTDGLDRSDEVLRNNPDVVTPHLIDAGTVLRMAPATV